MFFFFQVASGPVQSGGAPQLQVAVRNGGAHGHGNDNNDEHNNNNKKMMTMMMQEAEEGEIQQEMSPSSC